MGSETIQIPIINFSSDPQKLERGSEAWQILCKEVREACENHGVFEAVYDKISAKQRNETFSVFKHLFKLPLETKRKNINTKPYHGFVGGLAVFPLYEGFGIENASDVPSMKSFMNLMWPEGNDQYCQTINSMMKQMDEMMYTIMMMILDSYGFHEHSEFIFPCNTLLRVMNYKTPPEGKYSDGLTAHNDKPIFGIICEDETPGLEVATKDGQWIKLLPSPDSFIFFVGDPLTAWSNGKMYAPKHRVMMEGNKERYSFGTFAEPLEGTIIKTSREFVDEKQPQIFKEFEHMDYVRWAFTEKGKALDSPKQLYTYAGTESS